MILIQMLDFKTINPHEKNAKRFIVNIMTVPLNDINPIARPIAHFRYMTAHAQQYSLNKKTRHAPVLLFFLSVTMFQQ